MEEIYNKYNFNKHFSSNFFNSKSSNKDKDENSLEFFDDIHCDNESDFILDRESYFQAINFLVEKEQDDYIIQQSDAKEEELEEKHQTDEEDTQIIGMNSENKLT